MQKVIKILLIIILLIVFEIIICGNINKVYAGWADGARNFINSADQNININSEKINEPSSQIYNVLTSVGMIIAVVIGVVLGIQYMFSAAEEKAKVLETILPYLIGCVITFGAFGIWKILINTFYNI